MSKGKQTFIKTNDEYTSIILQQNGLELIDYSNGIWTFINNPTMTFDNKKNIKVTYSNILNM